MSKTAEDFAQKARGIVMGGLKSFTYDVKECDEAFDKLIDVLQEAMTQPVQFGDDVPEEEGWYWYECSDCPIVVKISRRVKVLGIYYAGTWKPITDYTGKWSPRLTVAGGE